MTALPGTDSPAHEQQAAGFVPSRDGLAFTNSWPSAPGVAVRMPFGTVGIGDASRGLCGGMIFAALDYWHAHATPPTVQPPPGSPLYRYIVGRLIDSWHLPAGVARYYRWQAKSDGYVARRTVEVHWPQVKAALDRGEPAVLGLVTVTSANPGQLGRNHQVLACRYHQADNVVTLQVYDPNSGPNDRVFLQFEASSHAAGERFEPSSHAAGAQFEPSSHDAGVRFAHNINIGLPVRGFFLTRYSPAPAPPHPGPPH